MWHLKWLAANTPTEVNLNIIEAVSRWEKKTAAELIKDVKRTESHTYTQKRESLIFFTFFLLY